MSPADIGNCFIISVFGSLLWFAFWCSIMYETDTCELHLNGKQKFVVYLLAGPVVWIKFVLENLLFVISWLFKGLLKLLE